MAIFLFPISLLAQTDELIPKRYQDGTYGYVNRSGSFAITPKFHRAFPFVEGYARVQMYGNWGLIDTKGNYVVDPEYQYVGWSDDPYFIKNKQWLHLVNSYTPTGRSFFPPSNGHIAVLKDKKWYPQKLSSKRSKKAYDSINHFLGGFASVYLESKGWNFISESNHSLQTEKFYLRIKPIKCGLVGLLDSTESFTVFDPKKSKFLGQRFLDIGSINEEYFSGRKTHGWGLIKRDGEELSEFEFKRVTYLPFIAKVKLTPKNIWHVLDEGFNSKRSFQVDSAFFSSKGDLVIQEGDRWTFCNSDLDSSFGLVGKIGVSESQGYWILSKHGQYSISKDFKSVDFQYDSLFWLDCGPLVRRGLKGWFQLDENLNEKSEVPFGWRHLENGYLTLNDSGYLRLIKPCFGIFLDSLYSSIEPSKSGLFKVTKNGLSGLIDSKGEEIIPPGVFGIEDFGKGRISKKSSGSLELLNSDGQWILLEADQIQDWSENSILVKNGNKFRVLTNSFQDELGISFDYVSNEFNGYWRNVRKGRNWFTIDVQNSEYLYPPKKNFDSLGTNGSDLIPVWIKGNMGFVDRRGVLVISTQYESVKKPSAGLFPFKIKGKWGLFDKSEKIILQPRYSGLGVLGQDIWVLSKDRKLGLFKPGKGIILEPILDDVRQLPNTDWILGQKEGKWGLFDEFGSQKLAFKYDLIESFGTGQFLVKRGAYWDLLDEKFQSRLPFKIESFSSSSTGYYLVQKKEPEKYIKLP